jgi:hypothetical protein
MADDDAMMRPPTMMRALDQPITALSFARIAYAYSQSYHRQA